MSVAEAPLPSTMAEVRCWALRSLEDLAGLRAELEAALPGRAGSAGQPDDDPGPPLIQRIVLVASELATNALRHGAPPVTVRLLRGDDLATIDVIDRNPDSPPLLAGERAPGAGGFGLVLARRAAHQLGWCRTGPDEKHVWACFSVTPAAVVASV